MKVLVQILALATIIFANEAPDIENNFFDAIQKCSQEHSIDGDLLEYLQVDSEELSADENIKCAFKCTLHKLNYVNSDKKFEMPKEDKSVFPENSPMLPILEECTKKSVLDSCDSAYKFWQCCESRLIKLSDQ